MEPARQKWIARIILLTGAIAGLTCLGRLNLDRRVSTDVLDLVPTDARSPELTMVRNLAGQEQARVLLLALRVPAKQGEPGEARALRGDRAAAVLAQALASFPAIAKAMPPSDPKPRDELAAAIFAQRLELLLPAWLEEKQRQAPAATAMTFFTAPPTCTPTMSPLA